MMEIRSAIAQLIDRHDLCAADIESVIGQIM